LSSVWGALIDFKKNPIKSSTERILQAKNLYEEKRTPLIERGIYLESGGILRRSKRFSIEVESALKTQRRDQIGLTWWEVEQNAPLRGSP